MLMLLTLIYMLLVTEGANLMEFLPLMFSRVLCIAQLRSTLLAFEFSLGNSETVLCFMLVYSSKTAPRPGVPLGEFQFVVI